LPRPVQRRDAESIPSKRELVTMHVIQRHRELTAHALKHSLMTFLPQMRNDLRVAVRVQMMPASDEFRPLLGKIKELAVEDREGTLILIAHRLLAIRQTDDAQPPRSQRHTWTMQETLLVWSSMSQRPRHSFDHTFGHRSPTGQVHHTSNATHRRLLSSASVVRGNAYLPR
jgi:hypothetical protein